jgi:hypothetical protein
MDRISKLIFSLAARIRCNRARSVFFVEDTPEGGFTARALDYSIYTQANTWSHLKHANQDAVTCHFDEPQNQLQPNGAPN